MSNTYKLSTLNPIRFHQYGVGDFAYNNIPFFEAKKGYVLPYRHGDLPYIQVLSSNASAVMAMKLVDNSGTIYKSWGVYNSGATYDGYSVFHWFNYFPFTTSSPAVPDGIYFLKLTISDADGMITMYSEPIHLATWDQGTVAVTYTHDENDFDSLFTDGVQTYTRLLRVHGGMRSEGFAPGGKFTMFQDLNYNSILLQSQPFTVEKFSFGDGAGLPNHMGDTINRIFGLSTVKIDGVQYSRNEGAKLERSGETGYPLAGWSLELVRTANSFSESFIVVAGIYFLASSDLLASSDKLVSDEFE